MSLPQSLKVLITGATSFIGHVLLEQVISRPRLSVRVTMQRGENDLPVGVESVHVLAVNPTTDWRVAVTGVDVVVHAAASVHVLKNTAVDPLAVFRYVNVAGVLNLARQAVDAGVRRFVFISSIMVNGGGGPRDCRYTAADVPAPNDFYGITSWEAEEGLRQLAGETGMEVVIIRPPLIYGPGVTGNFLSMIRWLNTGIPLPFGAIGNKRSLVSLGNLVDLIVTCIDHPAAANQIFLVSDGDDLSTTELIRRMARALGKPARLIPVPTAMLMAGAVLLGKRAVATRLCGSLQADITKTQKVLAWTPCVSIDQELQRTVEYYLQHQRGLSGSLGLARLYSWKRVFDFLLAGLASCLCLLPIVVIALLIRLTSPGPVLYWADRLGQNNVIFQMPKFRTMRVGAPVVATDVLPDPKEWLTPLGGFLRRASLDELPQLWSILIGDMSFVGPRPALFNQDVLISLRMQHGVHRLVPGLTGWAQVNGRDALTDFQKVKLDQEYLMHQSFWHDIAILLQTASRVVAQKDVLH